MYGSITEWRAYAAARGNNAPTSATDQVATAALTRASDYIRTRYVLRSNLTGTELDVLEATYIAASYELDKPGFFAATYTPGQAKVLTEVKGIKWTPLTSQGNIGPDGYLPVSPAIDALLGPYLVYGATTVLVV